MKTLLVTGGIGSGKSYVVKILNAMGFPSYDCDSRAKEMYDADPQLLGSIVSIVGDGVLKDGRISRSALATIIFSDSSALSAVENAVHPALVRDFERWRSDQLSDIVVIESAIMLQKPVFRSVYDFSLSVTAPDSVRLARAMERDGADEVAVRRRMADQWSDGQRNEHSDFVILNDGVSALVPALASVVTRIKALCF